MLAVMPTYTYRCPAGHITERTQSIHDDVPASVPCTHEADVLTYPALLSTPIGAAKAIASELADAGFNPGDPIEWWRLPDRDGVHVRCLADATRVFQAPAAIHFKGRGFYATDVKGAQERKRRPNPGDDLPVAHQPDTAAIARSL